MASVSATYTFADGDSVGASVDIENDYPDALAQAAVTCAGLLRDAMAYGVGMQDDEDDD